MRLNLGLFASADCVGLSIIPTIFYCHYPDSLLAPRNSSIRILYRFPYDLLEKYSMLRVSCINTYLYFQNLKIS